MKRVESLILQRLSYLSLINKSFNRKQLITSFFSNQPRRINIIPFKDALRINNYQEGNPNLQIRLKEKYIEKYQEVNGYMRINLEYEEEVIK